MQRKAGVSTDQLVGRGGELRHDRLVGSMSESHPLREGVWPHFPIWPHRPPSEVSRSLSLHVQRQSKRANGFHSPAFVHRRSPFHFLRHGETRENRDGIVQGQSDTELTAAGQAMAFSAAQILAEIGLGSIYASPLKRTWLTAWIVAELSGLRVRPMAGLMERHWGAFEGKPKAMRPQVANPETAEPIDDFSNRVVRAMDSMTGPPPILVVAHSGVFRVLCAILGIGGRGARLAPGQVATFMPPAAATGRWRLWPLPVDSSKPGNTSTCS